MPYFYVMLKKIISVKHHTGTLSFSLLLLRLMAGIGMLTHGYPKLQKLISGDMSFGDPLGVGEETSLILAVLAEFLCSLLVVLGLFTRLAVIPLIVTMSVVVFIVHSGDGFGKQEKALMYLVMYLVLLVAGSGKFSIDKLMAKK
jgi:putative oxidoreductase